MSFCQKCISSYVLLIISITIQSQNLRTSIRDDIKKDLLKEVKPKFSSPSQILQQHPSESKVIQNDDLLEFYKKYKSGSGGAEFEPKLQINPHVTTYNGKDPINKQSPGYVEPVFDGGRWILANPIKRVDGLVIPSGLDLSFSKKKKLSKKSRKILTEIFGLTLDDE